MSLFQITDLALSTLFQVFNSLPGMDGRTNWVKMEIITSVLNIHYTSMVFYSLYGVVLSR